METLIRFACSGCGRMMKTPVNHVGRTGTCRACGNKTVVPAERELQFEEDDGAQYAGPNTRYCHHCGRLIASIAEICPKCGVRQLAVSVPSILIPSGTRPGRGKSKTSAAVLAFFLGGLGAHKFYLGGWFWGIAYALTFWTFIPAIIACIEGIVYLAMSESDFDRRYNFSEVNPFTW
jgi:TM2 domain-containing membrane protein YozV/RNA polymerase subunit RPABC4/transcription elongation factor Spt4